MLDYRFLVHIILSLQLHHCIIIGPETRQETAVERECNNFGTSVGRLEWRALLKEDELTVRCDLNHADPTLNYDIVWTYGFETESRKALQLCEYDQTLLNNGSEISCQYKHKISKESEYKKLVCWVKTRNVWDSETRTACISEEIPLSFETYEVPGTTDVLVTAPPARKKASIETLRADEIYLVSKSEEDQDKEFKWKEEYPTLGRRRGRYSVEIGPDIRRTCQVKLEDNSTELILWKFWARTNLKEVPQNIQFNCSVSFEARFSGIFTLYINKGIINNTTKRIINAVVIKKCIRSPEVNNKFVKCGLTWNLSDSDLGPHVVSAHFRYLPCGKTVKDYENQDCDLLDEYIQYQVTRIPPNKTLKLTAAEMNDLGIDYLDDPSTSSRDVTLPWNTWPKKRSGTTLNSKELIWITIGGIFFVCLIGCIYARWSTEKNILKYERKAKEIYIRRNPELMCRCSVAETDEYT